MRSIPAMFRCVRRCLTAPSDSFTVLPLKLLTAAFLAGSIRVSAASRHRETAEGAAEMMTHEQINRVEAILDVANDWAAESKETADMLKGARCGSPDAATTAEL